MKRKTRNKAKQTHLQTTWKYTCINIYTHIIKGKQKTLHAFQKYWFVKKEKRDGLFERKQANQRNTKNKLKKRKHQNEKTKTKTHEHIKQKTTQTNYKKTKTKHNTRKQNHYK